MLPPPVLLLMCPSLAKQTVHVTRTQSGQTRSPPKSIMINNLSINKNTRMLLCDWDRESSLRISQAVPGAAWEHRRTTLLR